MAPFNPSARRDKLDSTCTGRMPGSAVLHGAIRVLVSAAFFMSMASSRPVHTISRFVCMGCKRQGEFRRLYGSLRAATTHVGMSPDCLAACARAWYEGNQCCCRHGGRRDGRRSRCCGGCTRRAPSATGLYQLILIRVLYNLGYPGLSWVIPKHRLSWDILGYLGISRLGVYPGISHRFIK